MFPGSKTVVHILIAIMFFSLGSGCSAQNGQDGPGEAFESPVTPVNYTILESLLQKYVEDGKVDYIMWKKNDLQTLEKYITSLETVSLEDLTINERKAFWLNTYNAVTLYAVLKRIPGNKLLAKAFSVQIVPGFFGVIRYNIAGESLTLNDIENEKLRKGFQDARIHFAIVCASGSCPQLQNRVFKANDLDTRLDAAAMSFVQDVSRNRFDMKKDILFLSKIFKWFKKDFVKDSGSVIDFVKKYMDLSGKEYLNDNKVRLKYLKYDWKVNIKK